MRNTRRLLFLTVIGPAIFLSLGLNCGRAASSTQAQGQNPPVAKRVLPSGWKVFRGQHGLVVLHPGGWNVLEYGGGAFVAHDASGPNGGAQALVYVQPFEKLEGSVATVLQSLDKIRPGLFPALAIERSRLASTAPQPEVAVAQISFTPKIVPFKGTAMCFREGLRGVIYVIASTAENWAREEPVMEQILSGFFYSATDAPRTALPRMGAWRDPQEAAFTIPVPEGWNVKGGLRRFSAVDTRPEVFASSPDNTILLSVGNSAVPPFSLPTRMGMSLGFAEGQWYSPNGGLDRSFIMRYLPGASFLTQYYLPQVVGQVGNLKGRELPELSQQAAMKYRMAGMNARADAAEVTFDASTQAGPRKGYAFVQTVVVPFAGMPEGGVWYMDFLYMYLAEANAEPMAQALLGTMVQGFRWDPAWMAGQVRTAGQVSQIESQAHNEIMGIITQTFDNKWRTEDRVFENGSRVRRGQVLIEDPDSGQRYEVPVGSNYYFRVGAGNDFVGTDSANSPCVRHAILITCSSAS
jgi:hypothetical protein